MLLNISSILICIDIFLYFIYSVGANNSNNSKETFRTYDEIIRSGELRVGLTCDYAPYSYMKGKEILGADVTMAKSLAAELKLKLNIVKTTWANLEKDLRGDKFDIAMGGISVNKQREQVGYFSIPLLSDGKRPIVRCEDSDKYTSIEAINKPDVTVIVNPGGTNQRFTKQWLPNAKVIVFNDNRFIHKEIAAKRADLMITDGVEVDFQSRIHSGVLCPANVEKPFDNFEKAYWMHKDPRFLIAVNEWLQKARKETWSNALDQAVNYEKYY